MATGRIRHPWGGSVYGEDHERIGSLRDLRWACTLRHKTFKNIGGLKALEAWWHSGPLRGSLEVWKSWMLEAWWLTSWEHCTDPWILVQILGLLYRSWDPCKDPWILVNALGSLHRSWDPFTDPGLLVHILGSLYIS